MTTGKNILVYNIIPVSELIKVEVIEQKIRAIIANGLVWIAFKEESHYDEEDGPSYKLLDAPFKT